MTGVDPEESLTPAVGLPESRRPTNSRATRPVVPYIAWAQAHRLRHRLIELGKPMRSGYIEGYFGKVLAQRELVPDLGSDSYPPPLPRGAKPLPRK
jgi:hypothetical protein